mgnify:FL=1
MVDTYWGYHAMMDCARCNLVAIKSKDNVYNFLKELVDAIDMVPFGEPMIEHFATHDPDKAGISFCQMIETSNISGHLVDINGDAYIDVFSCKEYDVQVAKDIVEKYFSPKTIRVNFVTRQA